MNLSPGKVRQEDMDAVKAAGWADEAIYDAVNVCALFNFYNRFVDAHGVGQHSAELYQMSGERLAQGGYAEPPAPIKGGP